MIVRRVWSAAERPRRRPEREAPRAGVTVEVRMLDVIGFRRRKGEASWERRELRRRMKKRWRRRWKKRMRERERDSLKLGERASKRRVRAEGAEGCGRS